MHAIHSTPAASRARPEIATTSRAAPTKPKMFGMPAAAVADSAPSLSAGAASSPAPIESANAAKSLTPAPASTVAFAQQREGGVHHAPAAAPAPIESSGSRDVDDASPADRAAVDLDALMNDLTAMAGTNTTTGSDTSPGSTDVSGTDASDFGSFVDSVLKQYAQTASTGASNDLSGLVAQA